jgi:hypothetical protein
MKFFSYDNSSLKHYCLPGCDAVHLVGAVHNTECHVREYSNLSHVARTSNPTIIYIFNILTCNAESDVK